MMNITADSLEGKYFWSDNEDEDTSDSNTDNGDVDLKSSGECAGQSYGSRVKPGPHQISDTIATTFVTMAASVSSIATPVTMTTSFVTMTTSPVTMTSSSITMTASPVTMTSSSVTMTTSPVTSSSASLNPRSARNNSCNVRGHTSIDQLQASVQSPWEKWLIRKTQEEYEKKKIAKANKANEKRKEAEHRKQAALKRKQAEQYHREWVKSKVESERKLRTREAKMKEKQKRESVQRQNEIKLKADEHFEQWKREKERERKLQLKQQQVEEELKERAVLEKKERAREVYARWLEEVELRYEMRGYGYCDNTPPTYVNRKKWIGPCETSGEVTGSTNDSCSLSNIEQGLELCKITTPTKVISIRRRQKMSQKYPQY